MMDIPVGTYDIDFAGHVSNIVYLRWFELLRLKVFEAHYPLEAVMERGIVPIIASHFVEYKKPIRLFDKPRGYMWIEELGQARLKFKGEIIVNDELATSAEHMGLFVDKSTMRPVRMPRDLVQLIKAWKAD